jgi:hypothetical protein
MISTSQYPELAEAKQRCIDHFEDCPLCGPGRACPEGEALVDASIAIMRDCVRRKRQ